MKKLEQRVPNLRFKGFTDDWEQRKLGDIANIGDGLHGTPKYDANGKYHFINGNNLIDGKIQITKETKRVSYSALSDYDKSLDNLTLLMSINGTIGQLAFYNKEPIKLGKSVAYIRFGNLSTLSFYYGALMASNTQQYFNRRVTGTTIKNLGLNEIRNFKYPIPSETEQKKIGKLIKLLNATITLQQRKLDLLKQLKKGLLQKMFAEKNSKQPVLRFKGFHDDWEQHRLKDTQTVFTDGNYSSNYPKPKDFTNSSEGIPFLKGSDITDGSLSKKNCKFITLEKNSKLISGQIVPDDVVIAVRGSLGNVGYATKENAGWNINSQLAIIRTNKSELKGYFIYSFFLTNIGIRCIRSRITGTALKQLPIKQLASIFVPIANIKEQLKLVRLLKKMDKFITLQQQKLAKYQSIKRSLLQQMFI